MRVGFLRRVGAFILDFIPIIAVLSLLFQFLVGDILKPEDFDSLMDDYNLITENYNTLAQPYMTQLEDGDITQEEYEVLVQPLIDGHAEDTTEHTNVLMLYYQTVLFYYIISFTMIYYVYSGVMKGSTLGRKITKTELSGKVTWWTLFLREVIWKTGYYMLTLGIGGLIIDFFMISFTAKKKAPRDYISKIDVKFEGVDYPF